MKLLEKEIKIYQNNNYLPWALALYCLGQTSTLAIRGQNDIPKCSIDLYFLSFIFGNFDMKQLALANKLKSAHQKKRI